MQQGGVMSISARLKRRDGHLPAVAVRTLLNNLAVGWIEGDLFYRWISSGRGSKGKEGSV